MVGVVWVLGAVALAAGCGQSGGSGPGAGAAAYRPQGTVSAPAGLNGFAAVVTASGDVYLIGGIDNAGDNAGTTVGSVWQLRSSSQTWQQVAALPLARDNLGAAQQGAQVYAIGGDDATQSSVGATESFSPKTRTWRELAAMPTPRDYIASAVDATGTIYAIGGGQLVQISGGQVLATVEAYHPASDTWTSLADMPTARWGAAAATLDGRLYVIGGGEPDPNGSMGDRTMRTVEVYSPKTDTWQQAAPLPQAGEDLVAFTTNGQLYVTGFGGGFLSNASDQPIIAYDPTTNRWHTCHTATIATDGVTAAALQHGVLTIVDANGDVTTQPYTP
jgi:N-acetylneuraminic acid mutarotase